jgi:uncharacterized lipoprotein YajG
MSRLDNLRKRQEILKNDIARSLDFVIGTVTAKGPSTYGYNLTTKVEGKTVSAYVPKALVETVREMTQQHQKVKGLMQELSRVNWEILKLEAKQR